MEYPSTLIENAVHEIAKLPGIGKKTALRLALHLLKEREEKTTALTEALTFLRKKTLYCQHCYTISDDRECVICKSQKRNREILCVVEDTRDVLAIENTSQYTGLYHVLGGIISPIGGVGPSDLTIDALIDRVADPKTDVREIILALSATLEGDTTSFYLGKRLKDFPVKLTAIARGIPVGGSLEYADEITLGRSIITRSSIQ